MRSTDVEHSKWLLDIGDGKIAQLEIPDHWQSPDVITDIYGPDISPEADLQ